MTELAEMAARLSAALPRQGGLTIFGDSFGGWDGVQTLVAAKAIEPEPGEPEVGIDLCETFSIPGVTPIRHDVDLSAPAVAF